ncbi:MULTISPECIES: hypothetical protein [Cryobacterium]|uniref:Uncharacterized protein n=1 Tax=Cryobacterium breve TaxID=1259258 RepID=A0ABY2IY35_9MICO|nr:MULTISPECIES: hypothetical protein [Cryobacterium]TFC96809.1 hypothetical protein E3T20_02065 [Cryobacterium sp. TmT3-12]TFC97395.1 hypothetical protein E3O65_11440 [Cryobacterium breve]
MKLWIIGVAGALGLSIFALLGVYVYVDIGWARGEQWASLNGPEPIWPAVVGFGAMYLIPISALVMILLVGVAIARSYLPGSSADSERSPIDGGLANTGHGPVSSP